MPIQTVHQVDARGLSCPMPIVKSAQAIKALVSGELIEVLANPMKAGGRMRPLLDELLDLVELAQRS